MNKVQVEMLFDIEMEKKKKKKNGRYIEFQAGKKNSNFRL